MAQNLTSLFGSAGAARFVQLLQSPYRLPCYELHALEADGVTVRLDLTAFLVSWSTGEMTDDLAAASGTLQLANPNGFFDRFKGGAYSDVLRTSRILSFRKGLIDPANGQVYLLPAQWGTIIQVSPTYSSQEGATLQVTIADALKDPLKLRFTSDPYENWQVNQIAGDLLQRFGYFAPGRIALTDIDHVYPFAQFPDYGLADALKTLFDPLLLSVRADEAGRITTRPRLGSGLSGAAEILGYPDQLTAPAAGLIAYTIPDGRFLETITQEEQDYDGVINQVKVLGQAAASQQTLGPNQQLFGLPDSSIDSQTHLTQQQAYTQNGGGGTNAVIAQNVYVVFKYSTDHHLDDAPQTKILSLMTWRGDWAASASYMVGEAVSHGGQSYACSIGYAVAADGSTKTPGLDGKYWEPIPVSGPFASSFHVDNADPHQVGSVELKAVTSSYLVLLIQGKQYSVGHLATRHHGGFEYSYQVFGQPVLSSDRTLTAYADYNPTTVTGEALSDPFADHQTFQAAHQPLAMGTPVEAFLDGTSLGKIAADGTDISGETNFSVDFERGRIVLKDLTFRDWSEDDNTSHPFSSGGTVHSTTNAINRDFIGSYAPEAIFQSSRQGSCTYTFPGLVTGSSYDLRLHFADPDSDAPKKRVFSIYINGFKKVDGLDILGRTGSKNTAWEEELTGIAPDTSGQIVIVLTQHDPFSGDLLGECSDNGNSTGTAIGTPLICGIEIRLPQGQGASPFAVNCGGPAYGPFGTGPNYVAAPVITASYAYSSVQGLYGIQGMEIDNPLIADQSTAQAVAGYWVNYRQWMRHRHTIRTASLPHIQPGDILKYYNDLVKVDFWGYVQSVSRAMGSGSDSDTFKLYLLFAQPR